MRLAFVFLDKGRAIVAPGVRDASGWRTVAGAHSLVSGTGDCSIGMAVRAALRQEGDEIPLITDTFPTLCCVVEETASGLRVVPVDGMSPVMLARDVPDFALGSTIATFFHV